MVETVCDGSNALERLASHVDPPIAFVIADWSTPALDGLDLAAKAAVQGVRTILMASSLEVTAGANRCAEMAAKILVKPVSRRQLLDAIADRDIGDIPTSPQSNTTPTAPVLEILLAEDNPVNQKVACAQLRKLNHHVTVATNGASALEQMQNRQFDLVLMDVQMPVMDGLTAATAIRHYEMEHALRRTPIIALTAHAMDGDAARCIAAGMDDYLSKPLQSQRLREVLAMVAAAEERLATTHT